MNGFIPVPPSPGHPDAISLGCSCPRIDNGHGRGCGRVDDAGKPLFWVNGNCPLHGFEGVEVMEDVDELCEGR